MAGKPTPTALKVLRGNPGRRPLNAREPEPPALAEAVPRELTGRVARREWRRTIAPAIRIGMITAADRALAMHYCVLFDTWTMQIAEAAKSPDVQIYGKNNFAMPNVSRTNANKTLLLLTKVESQLGFTPTTRPKVQVTPAVKRWDVPATGSALDRFLKKPGPA